MHTIHSKQQEIQPKSSTCIRERLDSEKAKHKIRNLVCWLIEMLHYHTGAHGVDNSKKGYGHLRKVWIMYPVSKYSEKSRATRQRKVTEGI